MAGNYRDHGALPIAGEAIMNRPREFVSDDELFYRPARITGPRGGER